MYYKAVVLEVQENYCIVMLDDSQIVRIKKKEGVREGHKIYVLEEDFYNKEEIKNGAVVVPFEKKKKNKSGGKSIKKKIMPKIVAAAAAVLVFAGTLTVPQLVNPVYATVSFDGEQSVQLDLDSENRVLSAKSYDGTVESSALKEMKGKNIDELWDVLSKVSDDGEAVLVASAPVNKKAKNKEKALEQYIGENLTNEKIICLRGDSEDVKSAGNEKKSLGIYILEKALADDDVAEHIGSLPYGKGSIGEFLERVKERYPQAYSRLIDMDDDFDDFDDLDDVEIPDNDDEQEKEPVDESNDDSEIEEPETEASEETEERD